MVATRPEHISAMRHREGCRPIPCKRLLADMVDKRMGFAQRLGILGRDLLQHRESLFSSLGLEHRFQLVLIALHLLSNGKARQVSGRGGSSARIPPAQKMPSNITIHHVPQRPLTIQSPSNVMSTNRSRVTNFDFRIVRSIDPQKFDSTRLRREFRSPPSSPTPLFCDRTMRVSSSAARRNHQAHVHRTNIFLTLGLHP